LFYIHESTTPDCFYLGHCSSALLPIVKATFAIASHVSFLTESTRRYYRPLLKRSNHSLNPGWIDLEKLDRHRAATTREALRARLHLAPHTRLVVNPGTVCERKGQHIFARAVDLLWRTHPDLAAHADFLMIGARDTRFDREMDDLLGTLNRPNLRLVPETPSPYDYYGAADVYVCSSYEESFPRVVLEAMGFSLPILSTHVHGIPEMVRADQEAVLVPPGDSAALAAGLARLLGDPEAGATLGARARARVGDFAAATLLPRHATLAARVGRAPRTSNAQRPTSNIQ
jgi:glycosyltransferase involved in cell wall biosynthesis